jgi:hypothetical protein
MHARAQRTDCWIVLDVPFFPSMCSDPTACLPIRRMPVVVTDEEPSAEKKCAPHKVVKARVKKAELEWLGLLNPGGDRVIRQKIEEARPLTKDGRLRHVSWTGLRLVFGSWLQDGHMTKAAWTPPIPGPEH